MHRSPSMAEASLGSTVAFLMIIPWLLLVAAVEPVHGGHIPGIAVNNTLNLAFLVPWSQNYAYGGMSASGFSLAIEEIQNRQLLPGYSIEWQFRDTWCEAPRGFRMAIDLWSETDDLDGIIGATCSVVCQPVSLLAAAWNIPVVSYACTSGSLSDKMVYPTFSRAVGTWISNAETMNAFMDVFGWTKAGIITTTQDLWRTTAEATKNILEQNNKTVIFRTIESTMEGHDILWASLSRAVDVMRAMKEEVRIVLLYTYPSDSRNLLVTAMILDMLEGYVYISMDNAIGPFATVTNYRPELQDEIWNGFLSMEPLKPSGPDWEVFTQRVIEEFQDPVWNGYPHLPPNATTIDVHDVAGFMHDAVLIWAYGVNRTLQMGGAPDDGIAISNNIFNSTFNGITGQVTIDEKGDRLVDQMIQIYQNGVFMPILIWRAAEKRMEIAYSDYSAVGWDGVLWSGGTTKVPLGYPSCGWENEFCSDSQGLSTSALVGLCCAFVAIFVGTLVGISNLYRYRLIQHAAAACRINWAEVTKVDRASNNGKSMVSFTSAMSHHSHKNKTGVNDATANESQAEQMNKLCEIYTCRKHLVKLNCFPLRRIGIDDKNLSSALSNLVMVSHENIVAFIGVTLDSPQKYVLTETVDRGTLYELLGNDDMELTIDYKIALLLDVASGMKYIHHSGLGYHSRLSSKCCLLDSKFACKISDYWIHALSSPYEYAVNDKASDKLWMAPEVICHAGLSSQCDVYSFGIIVQEVLLKDRPYAANEPSLPPHEIIELVAKPGKPEYRPIVPAVSGEWHDLCEKCWAWDQSDRPSFNEILRTLVQLNGGVNISFVESMFKRLEAHTRHLEEIVEQRSLDLIAEKIKAETLICELLPRSIFEQMNVGNIVKPETFDEVTMFFSDIEGFTSIASCAGPMDIVSLLNRLYTIFDMVLVKYDVYKVATIGDAYIVVSGLPARNGNRHAGEIASMSLELINSITEFEIDHMPGTFLRLRVGLHSGSCVGAVVGVKMSRYLLFGDMVNTGTKIEALGEAMRIHVSDTTTRLLEDDERFTLIPRQESIFIPGHGTICTFWLEDVSSAN